MPELIQTVTDIRAPAARVWSILLDFPAYPTWNPFITAVEGTPQVGERLKVSVAPPGGKTMTFRPVVLTAARERELRWLGRVILPGLFDGEHVFRLEQRAGGCRFHHSERFSGVLIPLFRGRLFESTRQGFEMMNAALRTRAERP